MSERVFVDTNVFLYADDSSKHVKAKRTRARAVLVELIRERRAVISTQIMQEYFTNAVKKLGISAERARMKVENLGRLDVILIRPELIVGAVDLHRLHTLSFWDALVIKAASAAGCTRVLTEDLNDGQVIDGVTVENPF